MSSTFSLLLSACRKPIFASREEVVTATTALLSIMSTSPVRQVNARPHETSENECLAAVRRFCRKDPSILEGLLNTVTKEVQQGGWRDLSSNRQVVLLALCTARHPPAAPAVQQREVDKSKPHLSSQESILALAEGLFSRGTAFGEEEAVILLLQLIQWKTPYSPKLVGAVEKYVIDRLTRPLDSSALLSCTVLTTALPELHQSPTMEKVLNVVADKAASLEAGTVGMICYRLARIGTPQHDRLAKSFGAVSARVGAEGDVFNCLQLFFFLCHQPAADPQTLPILCETIVAATLDKDSIVHLSRAIVHVKETQWRLIQSDWEDLVSSVYVQAGDIVELPVADGGLAGEKNTKEIHRFFLAFLRLQCHFTSLQISSTLLEKTSSAVSNFLSSRKEELISAADPPYPLVQLLLSAGNAHYTKCGLDWMGEMLLQQHNLTAIQAFRFLVLLGDLEVTQPVEVVDYVMDQFLKTASDIPPVQFCAALRSVRRLTDHALTDYHWGPILLTFSQDVLRSWFLHRTPTECVVEAVVDLHALGLREESLYAEALSYLSKKVGVSDETSCCSRKAAEMAKLFRGQLTPYPAVTEFLQIASEKGTDNASVLPSVWAAERDPGSKVIQRTPEEQHCLSLVKAVLDTPSHEREKLLTLATDYTNRVGEARPDDHKYFFEACQEKVFKEDKLLQQCLKSLIAQGIVPRLSEQSIAAVLGSLSSLRFAYTRTVKQFVETISQEQWSNMTADPLVEMVSSLCRWPVRSTTAQAFINARLSELHDVLTAHQVTEAIRGLLFLSVSPKSEVLLRLTARASRIASALNEYNVLTLFDSPNSFRLLSDPSVTTPLLLAAAHKVRDPAQRQRIGTKVARSDLPPDFLTPHLQRLRCLTPGESRPLQLSH